MSQFAQQAPAEELDDLDDNVAPQQQPQQQRSPPQDIGQLLADTKTDESVPDYVPPPQTDASGDDGEDGTDEDRDSASIEEDGRERGMLVMELARIRELFDHVPAIIGLIPEGVNGFAYLNAQPLDNLRYMRSTAGVYIDSWTEGTLIGTGIMIGGSILEDKVTKKTRFNLTGLTGKLMDPQNKRMKHAMARMIQKYEYAGMLSAEQDLALSVMMTAQQVSMENTVKSAIQHAMQGGTLDPKKLTPEAVKAAIAALPK